MARPPDRVRGGCAAVLAEVGRLRTGLDLLAARPDVDGARLGVIGHDFGGMLAVVEAAEDYQLRSLVIVAATPRWGDWFLAFWVIAEDRIDYLRAMRRSIRSSASARSHRRRCCSSSGEATSSSRR